MHARICIGTTTSHAKIRIRYCKSRENCNTCNSTDGNKLLSIALYYGDTYFQLSQVSIDAYLFTFYTLNCEGKLSHCYSCHIHEYTLVVSLLQLYMEAGVLYEKAQSWDKAAAVYIKLKNWSGITFCYFELHDYICMPCTFYYIH